MRITIPILFILVLTCAAFQQTSAQSNNSKLDFFVELIELPAQFTIPTCKASLSETTVEEFIQAIDAASLQPFLNALLQYIKTHNPDDWLYYQLVRKVSQYISPKAENYYCYTIFKRWFLVQSGYHARLTAADNYLLFYVQCDETIYNISTRIMEGKQYICLNYHDYGFSIDFDKHRFRDVTPITAGAIKPFSYKVARSLPDPIMLSFTGHSLVFI